ncbi:MAG: YkgJ family cysteine cluster protein [bacterium]
MNVQKQQQNGYSSPSRQSFPFDEIKNAWLPLLLDAYYIADQGVTEGIRRQTAKGRTLACSKGCSHCCSSHTTIPVYPLEVVGVYWYAIEKLDITQKKLLLDPLRNHVSGDPCPFLNQGACVIHPMRFLACRHFNVFDTVCAENEDAFFTRREDVLTPIKKFKNDALSKMLPFLGIKTKAQRKEAIKTGWIHQHVQVLQEIEWSKLADRLSSVAH